MTSGDEKNQDDHLSTLMVGALKGEQASIEAFFRTLLNSNLHLPRREQPIPLRNLIDFPNQLVDFLAIKASDRIFVPAFSTVEKLRFWGGEQILSRGASFKHLLEVLPDDCWLVINPANEIEKEISPWEILQLKGGDTGIASILKEIRDDQPLEDISYSTVTNEEYSSLKNSLIELGAQSPEILQIYLLKQSGKDSIGNSSSQALVGIKVDSTDQDTISAIEEKVRSHTDPIQIGSDRIEIYVGSNVEGSILLHLFNNVTPLYVREDKVSMKNVVKRKLKKLFSW